MLYIYIGGDGLFQSLSYLLLHFMATWKVFKQNLKSVILIHKISIQQ